MSLQEREKVAELKRLVEPYRSATEEFGTYFDYLRWLQGYKFNVEDTASRLRNHLKFRRVSPHVKPDYQPNESVRNSYYFIHPGRHCTSKDGYILQCDIVGRFCVERAKADPDFTWRDLYLYRCWANDGFEREMRVIEAETGKQCGIYLVWDLAGLEFLGHHGALATFHSSSRYFGEFVMAHNVEMIKTLAMINASPGFKKMWDIISAFLPEMTRKKVRIFSSPKELLADFEPNLLPVQLGGNLVIDTTDRMVAILPKPEKSPIPALNLHNVLQDLQKFSVPKGHSLHAQVTKTSSTDSVITWMFHNNGALDFGIFYFASDPDPKDSPNSEVDAEKSMNKLRKSINPDTDEWAAPHLVPMPICDNTCYPENGEVKVQRPGVYVFRLHYRSGWFFSHVQIHCRVEMVDGDGRVEAVYDVAE